MQTIYDYKRDILKHLKATSRNTIHEIKKNIHINNYQEHSNFLEALYLLELEGKIYNIRKGNYELFNKDKYKIDKIIKENNKLYLKSSMEELTNNITKGKEVLENDIVIITKDSKEIKNILKRDLNNFLHLLEEKLKKEPLTFKKIKKLAVARNKDTITLLKEALRSLEEQGKIYLENNSYTNWKDNLTLTKIELDHLGKPYFIIDGKRHFPRQDELNGAMQEDLIAVSKKGKHIVKIIKRNIKTTILEVVEIDGVKTIEPILIPNIGRINVRISSIDMKKLNIGDRITANITLEKNEDGIFEANYIDTIGNIKDEDIDLISLATKYGFSPFFSEEILKEANKLPTSVSSKEIEKRYDLRKHKIFTIDCDNTKDIDDAVSIYINEQNNYVLGVHIADVAHYIKRNSLLDKEAYTRGLSTYPANTVIPAFPPSISNGICSLNKGEDRLTKSCFMEISKEGELLNYDLVDSVINSKLKMSYSKVNKLLLEDEYNEEYAPFIEDLKLMEELSNILTKKRFAEGMLSLDEEEIEFIQNEDGTIIDISNKTNGKAGKIIENFMIMYNQCESFYLNYIIGTSINRIHETPSIEMIEKALLKLNSLGYDVKLENNSSLNKSLQEILLKYQDKRDYSIISNIILRSLPKAIYSPYLEGHFGLGLKYYTHSTSPIRRYPDLKAQQIIDDFRNNKKENIESIDQLVEICNHCSFKEQQADLFEKEVELLKILKYVNRHLGKTYYGIVTDITDDKAYIKTVTKIPGYITYDDISNITYSKTKNCLRNDKDQVILKVGDFIQTEAISVDNKALKVHFEFIKNLTLEEQNQKGATALRKTYIKKI